MSWESTLCGSVPVQTCWPQEGLTESSNCGILKQVHHKTNLKKVFIVSFIHIDRVQIDNKEPRRVIQNDFVSTCDCL